MRGGSRKNKLERHEVTPADHRLVEFVPSLPNSTLEYHSAAGRRRLTEREISILEKHTLQCRDIRGIFGDYYDDELPVSLKMRVTEHLAHCSECVQFAAEYHTVVEAAKTLREDEAPAGVRSRLRAALNERLGLSLRVDDK